MLGSAANMATVAIEIADMHPRFWMSLPGSEASPVAKGSHLSTPLRGEEMRDLLNQAEYWPNNWNKQQRSRWGKSEIEMPVFNVTVEEQQLSTQFVCGFFLLLAH